MSWVLALLRNRTSEEVVGLTYSTDRAFFDEAIVSAQPPLVHQRSARAMSVTRCDDFWGSVEFGTSGWQSDGARTPELAAGQRDRSFLRVDLADNRLWVCVHDVKND